MRRLDPGAKHSEYISCSEKVSGLIDLLGHPLYSRDVTYATKYARHLRFTFISLQLLIHHVVCHSMTLAHPDRALVANAGSHHDQKMEAITSRNRAAGQKCGYSKNENTGGK